MPDPARPTDPQALAEALLEAQVGFLAAQLTPERLPALLEEELGQALGTAATITLAQAVTREQVKAVARKYATQFDIPGAIPELANEIADRLYADPAHDRHTLSDVVARRHVEAFVSKFLELPLVRERLMESPLVVEIVAEWLYRLGQDAAAQNRELAGKIPGLGTLLGAGTSILGRAAPDAAVEIDARLRDLSVQTAKLILRRARDSGMAAEEPWIHAAVMDRYREAADRPVGALRDYVTQEDLEDLLVLVYEFWLSLRATDYIASLIDAGVDFFFDKYEATSLLELLEEFGLTPADLTEEAERFAPRIIELLRETGVLEAFLRRRLAPFYASAELRGLLAGD